MGVRTTTPRRARRPDGIGAGAATLGLAGVVEDGQVGRLLAGEHPGSGERLGREITEGGVAGVDLTFLQALAAAGGAGAPIEQLQREAAAVLADPDVVAIRVPGHEERFTTVASCAWSASCSTSPMRAARSAWPARAGPRGQDVRFVEADLVDWIDGLRVRRNGTLVDEAGRRSA